MELDPQLASILTFLLIQTLAIIKSTAKQSEATSWLKKFSEDTSIRIDKQDKIIQGHTQELSRHTGLIGEINGQLNR